MSNPRAEWGAKALFAFARGYHPELTWEQLSDEHRAYLVASARAVIEAVDEYDEVNAAEAALMERLAKRVGDPPPQP